MLRPVLLKLLLVFKKASILICLFLLIFAGSTVAQEIRVGIFNKLQPTQVLISVASGAYVLKVDTTERLTIQPGQSIYISKVGSELVIKTLEKEIGIFTNAEIIPALPNSVLKVLCQNPSSKELWFEGGISCLLKEQYIQLVNLIDIENYIGGVVEAETGGQQNKEFYKVQACITRTFALSNLKKHLPEGFNVCDQVHCQAYNGRPRSNPLIPQAVAETNGVIIVDRNLQLIDAVFHSNCGGETHNSEDYWVDTVSYLRSVKDPWCAEGLQYKWKQVLPKDKWLRYLYGNYNYPIDNSDMAAKACNFSDSGRTEYYLDPTYKIGMRRLRSDWNFRSTFFTTIEDSANVTVFGKGFGHGVGLCQEGAMKQAKSGVIYTDILHFYFKDVFVLPKKDLLFLKSF